jgi:hypothetical protein
LGSSSLLLCPSFHASFLPLSSLSCTHTRLLCSHNYLSHVLKSKLLV